MTQARDLMPMSQPQPLSSNGRSPNGLARNGHNDHALALPGGETPEPSALLRFLPALYSVDNEFAGRFLRIFETVLEPIEVLVDNQPYYFDPMLAPREVLEYMAIWVGLDEGEEWPLARRRALVAAAASLYRIRGTRRGIKQHVSIYSAGLPLVQERTNGFRLDPDARLGVNTVIGVDRPHHFVVTVVVERPDELDKDTKRALEDTLRALIDGDKPVDTSFGLSLVEIIGAAGESTRRLRR